MINTEVKLIKPGKQYLGGQGVKYNAGVSRKTAGSEKVCMNILPMPPGVHSIPHIHKEIETIAYLLEGECTLFYGEKLENHILVKKGEQIFIPENIPHTPFNQSKNDCIWVVVHSSGDDQDELISMPELAKELEKHKGKSEVETIEIKSKTSNILSKQNLHRKVE